MKNTQPANVVVSATVINGLKVIEEANTEVAGMVSDWYGSLVSCVMMDQLHSMADDDSKDYWKGTFEGKYKEQEGVTKMPTAYRSAKSVINSAISLDIELLEEDGTPRGKSAVEKDIKEAKQTEKSNADKILQLLSTVSALIDKANDEGENLTTVGDVLAELYTKSRQHA